MPVRIHVAPDVLSQVVDGQAVLLDLAAERYFSLDEVGTEVWHAIEGGADPDQIVRELATRYEADVATLRADVEALIARLTEAGLVRVGA